MEVLRPADALQVAQDGSKMAQDGPRWPQDNPKNPQDRKIGDNNEDNQEKVKISVSSRRELNFRGSWSPMLAPSWPKKAQDDPRMSIKWPMIGIKWPMMT